MREAIIFLRRNKLSFIVTALASLFTLILWPLTQRYPFALFIAATLLCAWREGPKGTLLTTALSTVLLTIICAFIPSPDRSSQAWDHGARLAFFVFVGLSGAYLSREWRRAIKSVAHTQAALASTRDALIFTDPGGHVTSLNLPAQLLTGWHPLNAVDQPLGLVFRPRQGATATPIEDFAEQVIGRSNGVDLPADTVLVSSQGKETPIEGAIVPLLNTDHSTAGMMVAFRDVSKQRQAESAARQREEKLRTQMGEALKQSEERFQAFQKIQAQLEQELKDQKFERTNAEAELGLVQEDLQQRMAEATVRHREHAEALSQTQENLEKQFAEAVARQEQAEEGSRKAHEELSTQSQAWNTEREAVEEKLNQLRSELEKQHIDEAAGQGSQNPSLLAELADRKASEEELRQQQERTWTMLEQCREQLAAAEAAAQQHKLQAEFVESLLESCDAGIFAFDRECRFTVWNRAMERITGFERGRVIGNLAFAVFPALEETGESCYFLEALAGRRVQAQSAVLALDGSRALLDQTFAPHQDEASEPLGGLVFVRELPAAAPHENHERPEAETDLPDLPGPLAGMAMAGEGAGYLAGFIKKDGDWLSFN